MGVLRIRLSEEEKEELKKEILRRIEEDGASDIELSDDLGLSDESIRDYIKSMINENRTSRLAINVARNARKDREREKKKERAFVFLKERRSKTYIKKEVGISAETLENFINELVEARKR